MNKFLLACIIAVIAAPSILSARQGADDMFEHGMPLMPAKSGATWSGESRPGMGVPPMMGSGMVKPPMMGSGAKRPPMMGSGMVKPPVGSGSVVPPELKGLGLAIAQLKPEDRAALVTLIKDFFTSKGIDLSKFSDNKSEIRDVRKSTQAEMNDMRKQNLEALKAKREEMKAKIQEIKQ